MIQTQKMDYQDDQTQLEGFYAYDNSVAGKRPLVVIAHDWSGRNEFAENKAKKLAELGYVGFALDLYGKGKIGTTNDEKTALMNPLIQDRELLQRRINAGFAAAKNVEEVDLKKTGAIGFCFGGLCALDLARSGADVTGVVSFHGLLDAPAHANKKITAKILVLHGHDDPMVPPTRVLAFEEEMTKANVDWQLNVYGNTKHAFMNPVAHDEKLGLIYNPVTEKRAWLAMKNFFQEIFA